MAIVSGSPPSLPLALAVAVGAVRGATTRASSWNASSTCPAAASLSELAVIANSGSASEPVVRAVATKRPARPAPSGARSGRVTVALASSGCSPPIAVATPPAASSRTSKPGPGRAADPDSRGVAPRIASAWAIPVARPRVPTVNWKRGAFSVPLAVASAVTASKRKPGGSNPVKAWEPASETVACRSSVPAAPSSALPLAATVPAGARSPNAASRRRWAGSRAASTTKAKGVASGARFPCSSGAARASPVRAAPKLPSAPARTVPSAVTETSGPNSAASVSAAPAAGPASCSRSESGLAGCPSSVGPSPPAGSLASMLAERRSSAGVSAKSIRANPGPSSRCRPRPAVSWPPPRVALPVTSKTAAAPNSAGPSSTRASASRSSARSTGRLGRLGSTLAFGSGGAAGAVGSLAGARSMRTRVASSACTRTTPRNSAVGARATRTSSKVSQIPAASARVTRRAVGVARNTPSSPSMARPGMRPSSTRSSQEPGTGGGAWPNSGRARNSSAIARIALNAPTGGRLCSMPEPAYGASPPADVSLGWALCRAMLRTPARCRHTGQKRSCLPA